MFFEFSGMPYFAGCQKTAPAFTAKFLNYVTATPLKTSGFYCLEFTRLSTKMIF